VIRSRPGFSPVETVNPDSPPPAPIAKLQKDMIPALNRRDPPPSDAPGLKANPGPVAPPVEVPAEVLAVAPEIIANPNPSPAPHLTNEE
jgi:hypothetical protein